MEKTQFNSWPLFTDEEVEKVASVLKSNKVNYWAGSEGREFEKGFAKFVGTNFAVVVSNGTVALDLALIALGVGFGDEVIVTCRTFLASATSIVAVGAIPVFADVDFNSQNISAETIRPKITSKTKAIICVHLSGWPCEMDEILDLAKEHDLKIVEDCAQAHGAKYKGMSVGGIGDIAAWSFCQDKIMTTAGEGGMVTTNDQELWEKVWSYKDHGKSYDAVYNRTHPPGHRWYCDSFGTNFRLTEMQAAVGRVQLAKMADWHSKRVRNYKCLENATRSIEALYTPNVPDYVEHAGYRFYAFIKPDKLKTGWSRDRIINEINKRGGLCFHGICPEVYREKAFQGTGWRPSGRLEVAKVLGETSLCFLVHPTLTDEEMETICVVLTEVMFEATVFSE